MQRGGADNRVDSLCAYLQSDLVSYIRLVCICVFHMAVTFIHHTRAQLMSMADDCANAADELNNREAELKRERKSISNNIHNERRKRARLLANQHGLGEADMAYGIEAAVAAKAKAKAKAKRNAN